MSRKLGACLMFFATLPAFAINATRTVVLTGKSNVQSKALSKMLEKNCPTVMVTDDVTKSDYALEAIQFTDISKFTLFGEDNEIVRQASAIKDICHAIQSSVVVEVVDARNLTQSTDVRGDSQGGVVAATVNGLTGRRTHTDAATINVIANGEHALLDCYERRTGCTTVGPGKYYGEIDGGSLWVTYELPITYKVVRDHYKVAGSW